VNFINQLDFFPQVILAVFLFTVFVQLMYYLFIYIRPVRLREKDRKFPNETPPVSVIICARNERDNLAQHLTSVLTQDYPLYEVIVVNDYSDDDTEELLSVLRSQYPHLRSTIIKNDASFINSKKFAATIGIKAAQYEWLLFTDADCQPAGPQWIRSMSKYFVENKDIVLGYGGYLAQKTFLNKWIRYDTCFNALRYCGFAMSGMPYTGIGRNLAYRKSLFYAHNGFATHAHILSGEEDMLVNQAATRKNVAVSFSSDTHTYAASQNTFRGWVQQKCGHFSISMYYKWIHTFLLGLEPFSRVLFWIFFVVLMFQSLLWQYILGIFLLRTIVFFTIFGVATGKVNVKEILPYALFFDLAAPFIYTYVYFLNKVLSRNNKWK
jgi:cellulose synthase/poly-beta-1,6-N-acetylglucosamine synthase-like glycosyltransferase